MFKITVRMFLLLAIALLVSSCKKGKQSWQELPEMEGFETEEPQEDPIPPLPERKMEVFGDPEIFDEPRLQFAWYGYDDTVKTIWSIKTDGTDLRQTLPTDTVLKYVPYINETPRRSPDNRWLSVDTRGFAIFNLEKGTVDTIFDEACCAFFGRNSEMYFYMGGILYRYQLEEGVIDTQYHYYLNNISFPKHNHKIVAVSERKCIFYDSKFMPIVKRRLTDHKIYESFISGDGSRLIYILVDSLFIRDLNANCDIIYRSDQKPFISPAIIDSSGGFFYVSGAARIVEKNIHTNKIRIVFQPRKGRVSNTSLSVINM